MTDTTTPADTTVTSIPVMYRDGDNYKRQSTIVVAGVFAGEQIDSLRATLDQGEFYAPADVDLPHLLDESDWSRNESDHCWHEMLLTDLNVRPLRNGEEVAFESAEAMITVFTTASTAGWPAQFNE